jgi:hypothetical protein
LPTALAPKTDTHVAVMAFNIHELFGSSQEPTIEAIVSLLAGTQQETS